MTQPYPQTNEKVENQALVILKLLWEKFLKQKLSHKIITLFFMLATLLWIAIFYTSFFLWKLFSFVMIKVFLRIITWYLKKS